jgi:CHAD domain-containing protein
MEPSLSTDINFLSQALTQRWQDFQARYQAYRQEPSEESVHDLRVASRRLLSMTELIRAVMPMPKLKALRKYLKTLLDSFDDLHDTQIMLVMLEEILEEHCEIEPFVVALEKREKRYLREVEKDVDGISLASLQRKVTPVQGELAVCSQSSIQLREHMFSVVDEAYALAQTRASALRVEEVATVHRLRIALKKFRYLIEILSPEMVDYPKELMTQLRTYQTLMGDIQDIDVMLESLAEFGRKHPQLPVQGVREYFQSLQKQDIDSVLAGADFMFTLWRKTPRESFAWVERTQE